MGCWSEIWQEEAGAMLVGWGFAMSSGGDMGERSKRETEEDERRIWARRVTGSLLL